MVLNELGELVRQRVVVSSKLFHLIGTNDSPFVYLLFQIYPLPTVPASQLTQYPFLRSPIPQRGSRLGRRGRMSTDEVNHTTTGREGWDTGS